MFRGSNKRTISTFGDDKVMGFMDKLKSAKDATANALNIGLDSQTQYKRAYEKGVFLQPPSYKDASANFFEAAEKFQKEGNAQMVARARANGLLYQLIETKNTGRLSELIDALSTIDDIEEFGSQTEMISASKYAIELKVVQLDRNASNADTDHEKERFYREAGETVMKLGTIPLPLFERLNFGGPIDKAMMRGIYYNALADFYGARIEIWSSPAEAQNFFQKALMGFRQSKQEDWSSTADLQITRIQAKRHCWGCGREMQGRDFFYKYYPAVTHTYHKHMVEILKQDVGMLDEDGAVTLCTVCGSIIEHQADLYATSRMTELRNEITPILVEHGRAINELLRRVEHLEKHSHHH